jgi:2-keto-4-pentenoate hydratase/2-oxohepta-3-ene-1,7-dioic acid hydratase in catechol pathway
MIFSIPKQISFLSKMTPLMKSDLINTDTPREAGLIQSGDTLIPGIEG